MAAALGDVALAKTEMARYPNAITARIGRDGYPPVQRGEAGSIYIWQLGGGLTPHEVALRFGHRKIYDLLAPHTPIERRFAIACSAADESAVRRMLQEQPDLIAKLPAEDRRVLADAAWTHNAAAVRLMLDIGFPVDETGGGEGTPLDRASIVGDAEIVDILLARGASVSLRNVYGGTPLQACAWGSLNFRDRRGDYAAVARKLLAAGATIPEEIEGSDAVRDVLSAGRVARP
jgi:hypothetical protein